jgi:hypothetical protein
MIKRIFFNEKTYYQNRSGQSNKGSFWDSITIDYCNRKVDHLQKVLIVDIRLKGNPIGL